MHILSTLPTSSHLTSITVLWDRCHYYKHFTNKELEAQSSSVTCPRSNSKHVQSKDLDLTVLVPVSALSWPLLCVPLHQRKKEKKQKGKEKEIFHQAREWMEKHDFFPKLLSTLTKFVNWAGVESIASLCSGNSVGEEQSTWQLTLHIKILGLRKTCYNQKQPRDIKKEAQSLQEKLY